MATEQRKQGKGVRAQTRPLKKKRAPLRRAVRRPLRLFLSFSSEDELIAKAIKNGLAALEDRRRVEVFFAPDLKGGADYRKQIRVHAAKADVFLLICGAESRNFGWCWFELGCFHTAGVKHTVCIRNQHVRTLPPQVETWQAYYADETGLRRFLTDFFVNGAFSNGTPLNAGVDNDEHFRARRDEWIAAIADAYARARVREKYFPKRLTITDRSKKGVGIDFRKAEVTGAAGVFGIDDGPIEWDLLKRIARERFRNVAWMDRLEEGQRDLARGAIGGSLPPIETGDNGLLLPVVSRVEAFDDVLKLLNVIFIDVARSDLERHFDDWLAPKTMPDPWVSLIRICNYCIKFRWNFLVPLESQLINESEEPRIVLNALLTGIKVYDQQSAKFFRHRGQVEAIFDARYRLQIRTALNKYLEWLDEARALSAKAEAEKQAVKKDDVHQLLIRIRTLNTTFLKAGSGQFLNIVNELSQAEPSGGTALAVRKEKKRISPAPVLQELQAV